MRKPAIKKSRVIAEDPSIACFFLLWSTIDPNQNPEIAVKTKKIPAIMEVEITDWVVKYAQ